MIRELNVENFKSIENLYLKCSKINIFIGEPNVGKSNIIESLGLFSSILFFENTSNIVEVINKEFIRYNNFIDLFHNSNLRKKIRVSTDKYQIEIRVEGNNFHIYVYRVQLNSEEKNKKLSKRIIRKESIFHVEVIVKSPGKLTWIFKTNFNDFKKEKNFPKVMYYKNMETEKFVSLNFDFLNPPSGNNLLTILQTNTELYKKINDILFSFNLKLMLREVDKTIELVRDIEGKLIAIPLKLVAESFHQLFLLLSAMNTCKNSIICLEEPETHLFPKYTKLIAELIAKNKNNNQYFISTHNPYFLISLIEKTKKEDLSIFAVSFQNNHTEVSKIKENELKELLEGEDPFFNINKYFE